MTIGQLTPFLGVQTQSLFLEMFLMVGILGMVFSAISLKLRTYRGKMSRLSITRGSKFCAPIVKLSIDADTGYVTQAARITIAKIIISKYLQNWKHLWETNVAVYTPIHNYDMTETRNLITADSMSENGNANGQDVTAHGRTQTEMDYKYGLNTDTDDPKPSDKTHSTEGGNTTTTSANSDQRNRVNAGEEQETMRRSGNIGVTTTQKLIQEERDLWLWNFFDQVFNDLDRELALMFHDPCRV